MIRAVLFDLDGVLVDSREAWLQVMNDAARAWGLPGITREAFLSTFGQGVESDAAQFYPGRSPGEVSGWYDAHFGAYAGHVRVEAGAREVLETLRLRGLSTSVVTNTPQDLGREIVRGAGLAPDLVLGATPELREKPAPDLVLRACERLAVSAAEAVMIGDSIYDRTAAEAAGVAFVGYGLTGGPRIERLTELPGWIAAR